jgi:hypothetical protein
MGTLDTYLPVAFAVGLLSSFHCIGMCGGIMGALTFGLPNEIRNKGSMLLPYLLCYNLGRVVSYGLAGGLFGLFGSALFAGLEPWFGEAWPQRLAAMVMIVIGLNIAGGLPQLIQLERLGSPLWAKLEPLGRALMPVRSLTRAFLYGLVWGWLPCGLVYAMLVVAAGQTGFGDGALLMMVFGLGTLPPVILTGMLVGRLQRLARDPAFRFVAGGGVALFGAVVLIYPAVLDWRLLTPAM